MTYESTGTNRSVRLAIQSCINYALRSSPLITRKCIICKKLFKTRVKFKKACSPSCSIKLRQQRYRQSCERLKNRKIDVECAYCHKHFINIGVYINKFCSNACENAVMEQHNMFIYTRNVELNKKYCKKYGIYLREGGKSWIGH